jgi:hypothetical protein
MTENPCTRRDFFRPLVRWTALSALLGTWAVAARRGPGDAACTRAVPCQRCGAFKGCALPPARSARTAGSFASDEPPHPIQETLHEQ